MEKKVLFLTIIFTQILCQKINAMQSCKVDNKPEILIEMIRLEEFRQREEKTQNKSNKKRRYSPEYFKKIGTKLVKNVKNKESELIQSALELMTSERQEKIIEFDGTWLSAQIKPEIFKIKKICLELDENKNVSFMFLSMDDANQQYIGITPIEITQNLQEDAELIKNQMLMLKDLQEAKKE